MRRKGRRRPARPSLCHWLTNLAGNWLVSVRTQRSFGLQIDMYSMVSGCPVINGAGTGGWLRPGSGGVEVKCVEKVVARLGDVARAGLHDGEGFGSSKYSRITEDVRPYLLSDFAPLKNLGCSSRTRAVGGCPATRSGVPSKGQSAYARGCRPSERSVSIDPHIDRARI